MSKIKEICEEKIKPIIENSGYELVDITYQKELNGMNLTFYIDNDKGITIDDCEKINKLIDPVLENLNPTNDRPYILCVSSPGIDRPLKSERDFQRNLNKEIEISFFKKQDGVKSLKGKLISFNENEIEIETEKQNIILNKSIIAHIVPVIEF